VTNLYEAIVANVLTKEFVDQNHESINKPLNETGMRYHYTLSYYALFQGKSKFNL